MIRHHSNSQPAFVRKYLHIRDLPKYKQRYNSYIILLSEEYPPHLVTILNITMSHTSMSTVYVNHANLPNIDTRKLPLILYEAVNELTPTQVKGAQLFTGIWSIWLKSVETKNYLLDGQLSLSIGNQRIFVYGSTPC